MSGQPTNSSQNTGLVVIIVGIFMVIIAFLAVTYLNSDTIKSNQTKNSQVGQQDRADLTQITCALWTSIGDPKKVDPAVVAKVEKVCDGNP
jgi:flagellar basal body-associated protein FliL